MLEIANAATSRWEISLFSIAAVFRRKIFMQNSLLIEKTHSLFRGGI